MGRFYYKRTYKGCICYWPSPGLRLSVAGCSGLPPPSRMYLGVSVIPPELDTVGDPPSQGPTPNRLPWFTPPSQKPSKTSPHKLSGVQKPSKTRTVALTITSTSRTSQDTDETSKISVAIWAQMGSSCNTRFSLRKWLIATC